MSNFENFERVEDKRQIDLQTERQKHSHISKDRLKDNRQKKITVVMETKKDVLIEVNMIDRRKYSQKETSQFEILERRIEKQIERYVNGQRDRKKKKDFKIFIVVLHVLEQRKNKYKNNKYF